MSTSSRRAFLSSTVAAAALPLIPGQKQPQGLAAVPTPSTIPLYAVEDLSGQCSPSIQGHYPSQLHAEESIQHCGMRKEQHAIRRVSCPSTGLVFHPLLIQWDCHESCLGVIDMYRQKNDAKRVDYWLHRLTASSGLSESRILADVERYAADPDAFCTRAPRHALDLPDVLAIDGESQTIEPLEYTDREGAIRAAAEFNAEQIDGDNVPQEWCIVVEVSESIPEVAYSNFDFSGNIGTEERTLTYAVRVVRPTEDEIARYGKPVVALTGGAV